MVNNKAQAYYLVNKIDEDLKLGKMENLVQQYLRSGIEIYSHQIYASTFAISNPFVKGFILADEAGLGKSMEALLIISQYYKRKNNILVIVPSPTIDTWLHNIIRTFEFRCYVLDNIERPKSESYHTSLDHFVGGIVLRDFALELDNDEEVKLFFKIPNKFKIPTPIGSYTPDWAVYVETENEKKLYFVIETKGSTNFMDLRDKESIRIKCGRKHFEALGTEFDVTRDFKTFKERHC